MQYYQTDSVFCMPPFVCCGESRGRSRRNDWAQQHHPGMRFSFFTPRAGPAAFADISIAHPAFHISLPARQLRVVSKFVKRSSRYCLFPSFVLCIIKQTCHGKRFATGSLAVRLSDSGGGFYAFSQFRAMRALEELCSGLTPPYQIGAAYRESTRGIIPPRLCDIREAGCAVLSCRFPNPGSLIVR